MNTAAERLFFFYFHVFLSPLEGQVHNEEFLFCNYFLTQPLPSLITLGSADYCEPPYGDNIDVKSPDDLYAFCMKEAGESKWKCGMCYQFSHMGRKQVRNHVESKHFPNTWQYSCKYCTNISNTKKALDIHMSVKHKN